MYEYSYYYILAKTSASNSLSEHMEWAKLQSGSRWCEGCCDDSYCFEVWWGEKRRWICVILNKSFWSLLLSVFYLCSPPSHAFSRSKLKCALSDGAPHLYASQRFLGDSIDLWVILIQFFKLYWIRPILIDKVKSCPYLLLTDSATIRADLMDQLRELSTSETSSFSVKLGKHLP
jgi:hypothetical protein